MSGSPLAAKLKLRSGQRAALINATDAYREELGKIPPGVIFSEKLAGTFDWVQIFVKNRAELRRLARHELKWVTLVSVNHTWSAFALRLFRPGEDQRPFR
jgi:hypothetical protein